MKYYVREQERVKSKEKLLPSDRRAGGITQKCVFEEVSFRLDRLYCHDPKIQVFFSFMPEIKMYL